MSIVYDKCVALLLFLHGSVETPTGGTIQHIKIIPSSHHPQARVPLPGLGRPHLPLHGRGGRQGMSVNYTFVHTRTAAASIARTLDWLPNQNQTIHNPHTLNNRTPPPPRVVHPAPTNNHNHHTAAAALSFPRGRPAALHCRLPPAPEPGGHRLRHERGLRAHAAGHHGGWVGLAGSNGLMDTLFGIGPSVSLSLSRPVRVPSTEPQPPSTA